ncbi:MAG: hypothetical protein ACO3JL_14115, partial [Myxococcota bacterium]
VRGPGGRPLGVLTVSREGRRACGLRLDTTFWEFFGAAMLPVDESGGVDTTRSPVTVFESYCTGS